MGLQRAAVIAHHAGSGVAGAVFLRKFAQIAEILEGLGIALADSPGFQIPVKDIDQLPGGTVAVGGHGSSLPVVLGQGTDFFLIGSQLFIIGFFLIFFNNALRPGSGLPGREKLLRVHHIAVHLFAAAGNKAHRRFTASELLTDSKGQLQLRHHGRLLGADIAHCAQHPGGLVIPIEVIGQVHQQIAVNLLHAQLLRKSRGHLVIAAFGTQTQIRVRPFQRGLLIVPPQRHKAAALPFRHLGNLFLHGGVQRQALGFLQPVHSGAEQLKVILRIHGQFRIGVQNLLSVFRQQPLLRNQADFSAVKHFRGVVSVGRRQSAQQQAKHQQDAQCLFHIRFLLLASIAAGKAASLVNIIILQSGPGRKGLPLPISVRPSVDIYVFPGHFVPAGIIC